MAINRVPTIRTLDGKKIKVSKWIACNPESGFANAVFEVEHPTNLANHNALLLSTSKGEYLVQLNRFHHGENLRVNGRVSKHDSTELAQTE